MADDGNMKKALFAVSDGVIGAAVLLAGGVYGGAWLDEKLHTAPWISVGLAMLGGGLGLARMVYKATQLGADSPSPRQSKTPGNKSVPSSPAVPLEGGVRQKRPFEDLDDEEN
jgi:F0F1-type ATP synthase assembly protein I